MPIPLRSFGLALVAATANASAQATFTGIGVLPGYNFSLAWGVSDDGQVVVGDMRQTNSMQPTGAFRWNGGTATVLPLPAGYTSSRATGVSGDGSTIVGQVGNAGFDPNARAAAWSGPGAASVLQNGGSLAFAANENGSVIVGSRQVQGIDLATRWSGGPGTTVWSSFQSYAGEVNAAGDVIGGVNHPFDALSHAFVTLAAGHLPLPNPVGGGFTYQVYGMNSAGTRMVGWGGFGGGEYLTFLWSFDGAPTVQVLPNPFGPTIRMQPAGITDAGVVVGSLSDSNSLGTYIWVPGIGASSLDAVMAAYGADLTNWSGLAVTDIAPDGRTLVGYGLHEYAPGQVRQEGWVFSSPMAVPTPSAAACLSVLGLFHTIRGRKRAR